MAIITALFDNNINNVAEAFLGVASTAAKSSLDGVLWSARTLPTTGCYNIAYGNDIAIAVSINSNGAIAPSSIDGINWISRTIPAAGASRGWYGCSFGNGIFVATTGGGDTTIAASSTDGLSWTQRVIGSGDWRSIAHGNGVFIAIGYGSNLTQISTDGITWTSGTTLPQSSNWIDITYDAHLNRFVAITLSSGTLSAYSDDNGQTWGTGTLPTTTTWRSITSNNQGRFVAVSNENNTYAAYSNDGINWSGSTMPAVANWNCISYGTGPKVFAASASGSVNAATSIDGITWDIQTQANVAFNKTIYAPITWRTGDSLTINNGAKITVDTDQKKFWISMTITNGELYITNSSTTIGNRFITGRVSGASAQAITPGSGLGSINVQGNWIQIGTGDTTANQIMTIPYTDYVPVIWVETGSTYEMWLNVSAPYGGTLKTYDTSSNGLSMVSNGQRGKFFIQIPNTIQDEFFILTGSTTVIGSRTILVSNTDGIKSGASISGTGIPATSTVEEVKDSNTLIINLAATAASTNITVTLFNPIKTQFTNQIKFGDGINGNKLEMGQKVRVPNLMLTSDTPTNYQTATIVASSAQVGLSFVLTNGGRANLNTCLFGDAYHNFNQAQSLTITDVGMSIPPAISEVYDLNINGLGLGMPPCTRAYSTSWIYRDVRNSLINILPMSYITGAVLNNIVTVTNSVYFATAGTLITPVGHLNISYSNDLMVSNIRCYSLFEHRGFHNALALSVAVNNSTFTNIESYGCPAISLQQSSNNIITNITQSESMFNYSWTYTAGTKISYDPETGEDMIPNKKYYFKTRTYFTRDRSEYTESREYSSTPFLASGGTTGESIFPDYLTAYCNNNGSALFAWTNRSPVHNGPTYDIYRSTDSGFTMSSENRVYGGLVATTTTWTHFGNKPILTSTAATRTINFNVNKTITVSGSTAINFLTDTDGATIGGGTTDWRIGDTLVVTGTVENNGTYTITGVTSNVLTVVEDLRTESNVASFVLTGHRPTINKFGMTASVDRTLSFNSNRTITASSGSFINDGYKIGDVITVTGTASNNKTFTLNTVTRLTLTVISSETMITESAVSSSATITPFDIQNNVTYYYKFRKYDTATLYSDSAEIEITPTVPQTNKNTCLRGTSFASPWVTSNLTVGTASRISPYQTFLTTAANQVAEALLLTSTNNNATLTQSIPTTSGLSYTFSIWVCNNATTTLPTVNGQIEFGTSTQSFTANTDWQKVSLTHTAVSGSTNVVVKILTTGQSIVAIGAKIDAGTISKPYLTTGAAPIFNVNEVRDINLIRSWCRSYGNAQTHSGIEIGLSASLLAGEMWTEIYCSSVKGFTPSIKNKVMNTLSASSFEVIMNQSSLNNTINGLTQVGKGTPQGYGLLYLALSSSNNKFKNFTYDLTGCYMSGFISMNTLSNNTTIRYWNIRNWRNYVTATSNPIIQATNAFAGLTIENLIMNNSDFPILNIGSDIVIKGMNGANATPANAATTYSLGSTTDGIGVAYTAVYDTIFNELYFTPTTGALNILFNASSKEVKPYSLTGFTSTPVFSNTGRLYLQKEGDSVEYTWPHKIIGVSGFRDLSSKLNGNDLGTSSDLLEGLKLEYSIKTTGDYSEYKELRVNTGSTIGITGETLSASDGFYLKIRLTAMYGMKYNTRSAGKNFIEGEVIKGANSLIEATVVRDYIKVAGTNGTGTLWLSNPTGNFRTGEAIVRSSDNDARATNVLTNSSYATFPSFNSYIDGFQLFTNIDYSNKYPDDQTTLTLTGLQPNSEIRIFLHGSTTELGGIENSTTSFNFQYTYSPNTYVDIVIMSLNYQYYKIDNYLLESDNSSIPVQQIYDRVFNNP